MTDLRKAAEMALEVLEELQFINASFLKCDKAAEALRQALAQPEQDELIKQAYLDGLNSGIEAEREACARLIEDWDSDMMDPRDGADAIRARGEK